ncbi:MAG TPA: response regulator [Polyangiaceae bacterium]|nr:response regulator [Polyangiaceae bacterium]
MNRIFVVEDEAIVREDIAQTLRELGYEVSGTAQSGAEALFAVEQLTPDLVLMDIKLAGRVDGIQTAAAIRKRWSIPVIYLTSHSDEATLARAKETGPHGYLLKPFNERDLRTAIEVALRKSELEKKLEQRERWFSTTLASVGDAVIATDAEERITFMNAVAEAATGWSKEDALKRPLREVFKVVSAENEPAGRLVARALRNGFRAELPAGSQLMDRAGTSHDVDDSIAPIIDAQGRLLGSVVVFRDITDKRRLEERVALAERLASVSTMAAGMAHEINNPLAAAVGNLEFAQQRLDELGEEVKVQGLPSWVSQALSEANDALRDAQSASSRVQSIVRDLKKFSRAEEPATTPVDLPDIIDAALTITRHLVTVGTSIRTRLGTTPLVVANEGRLTQVFANLLANAIQAGDPLRHSVDIFSGTDDVGRAFVEISDAGRGIGPEDLPRIFEPFFTTKGSGHGLGLGLSICQSAISALGGEISVESQLGKGTKFRVVLPAASEPSLPPPAPSAPPPVQRRARVLVIDDEEIVGRTVERILMRQHDVRLETDPRQALSLLARERFDVVLCDVTMPNVSGRQVYETVLAGNAELAKRIVFLTGGALSDELEEFLAGLGNVVIHKPFSVDKLLAIVQSYA